MERRKFLTAAASVAFVPSPQAGPYQDPAYIRELTKRVSRARLELGSGAIAAGAARHIQRLEPALVGQDRNLQEAASLFAAETVWTLNDACRVSAGDNIGRIALNLAKRSGSIYAQYSAYHSLAAINLDHGNPEHALIYATHAANLRELPDRQMAWTRLRRGWALAHVNGQENEARDEIETVRGLLRDTAGFSGSADRAALKKATNLHRGVAQYGQSLTVADMTGTIALALSDLGVYGEAQAAFNECIGGIDQSLPTLTAFFLSQQILSALTAAQLSVASDRMLKLARVAPLVSSPRVDNCMRRVLAQSREWATEPKIRTARDQLKALVAATA